MSPARLSGIEATRGIAAISVVLYHVARHLDKNLGTPVLKQIFQFGHAGVDFFFVISGFIILFVHFRDLDTPGRFSHYIGRRFTRLIPIYWFALSITLWLIIVGPQAMPSLKDTIISFTLMPSDRPMVLGVAWTLQFEVMFYVIFSSLIIRQAMGLAILMVWLCGTVLAFGVSLQGLGLPNQIFASYNLEFFFGMIVALALVKRQLVLPMAWLFSGLVLLTAGIVAEDMDWIDGYAAYSRLIYGVPSALIVAGIVEADRQKMLRTPIILQRLGSASYSIYLFQFAFIGVGWQILSRKNLPTSLPVVIHFIVLSSLAIIGSVAVSKWIEYPLMKWVRDRLLVRKSLVV